MSDAEVRGPTGGSGGINLVLVALVILVLAAVAWLVVSRGDDEAIEVDAPAAEAAGAGVRVQSSGQR